VRARSATSSTLSNEPRRWASSTWGSSSVRPSCPLLQGPFLQPMASLCPAALTLAPVGDIRILQEYTPIGWKATQYLMAALGGLAMVLLALFLSAYPFDSQLLNALLTYGFHLIGRRHGTGRRLTNRPSARRARSSSSSSSTPSGRSRCSSRPTSCSLCVPSRKFSFQNEADAVERLGNDRA
jgi:hypothetical protein